MSADKPTSRRPQASSLDLTIPDCLEPGESFTLTWGKELFSPVQYVNFEVGPFHVNIVIRPDETQEEAIARGNLFLTSLARADFEKKSRGFLVRVKRSVSIAKSNKTKSR
jgi:hypothetical protein